MTRRSSRPFPSPPDPRRTAPALLALTAVLLLLVPLVHADPHAAEPTRGWPSPAGWPEYGGNHHRTAGSPTTGPTANAHAPGTSAYTLTDRSFSSPVFDHEGHVYLGDLAGQVTRLNPKLEETWTSPALGAEIRSSVLVAPGGQIYVAPAANEEEHLEEDGDLFALDAGTGDVEWRIPVGNLAEDRTKYVLTAAPAYHPDGYLLQGSMDGHLYAVTLDGELLWRFKTHDDMDNKIVSTPAIASDGTIYFGSQNGRLYSLERDGTPRWHYEATREASGSEDDVEQIVAAPTIGHDGTVYFATRHAGEQVGVVYALEDQGDTVDVEWTRVLDEKVVAPVTQRDDGALFVGALDGSFYRIDPDDGSIQWIFNPIEDDPGIDNVVQGLLGTVGGRYLLAVAEQAVVSANEHVYVSYWNVDITQGFPPEHSAESPVYALDTESGEIQWRRTYDHTKRAPVLMPTTTDDTSGPRSILYLAGDDARVHAIGGVSPDPVRLPAPARPADEPEPDPDKNDTIHPRETAAQPANTTSDEDDNPVDSEDEDGFFAELPAPGAGILLLLLALLLASKRRRRRAYP